MGRIGCGDVDAEFVDAGGDGSGLSCSTRHRCRSQVAHTHPPAFGWIRNQAAAASEIGTLTTQAHVSVSGCPGHCACVLSTIAAALSSFDAYTQSMMHP